MEHLHQYDAVQLAGTWASSSSAAFSLASLEVFAVLLVASTHPRDCLGRLNCVLGEVICTTATSFLQVMCYASDSHGLCQPCMILSVLSPHAQTICITSAQGQANLVPDDEHE